MKVIPASKSLISLFFLFLFFTLNTAAVPEDKIHTSFERTISKITEASSEVTAIESSFIQERHLSLLTKVLVSKGHFYYMKPDMMRWEIMEPESFGFSVKGAKGKQWRGKDGLSRDFSVATNPFINIFCNQVFAWARGDISWLEARYVIALSSETPPIFRLVPSSPGEINAVDFILVEFSSDYSYVTSVEVHEKEGDFTRVIFSKTKKNTALDKDLFN